MTVPLRLISINPNSILSVEAKKKTQIKIHFDF